MCIQLMYCLTTSAVRCLAASAKLIDVVALHLQDLQGAGKAQDPEKGTVTGSDLKSQLCRSASIWELCNYQWVKVDLHWSLGKVAATATGSKKGGAGF